MYKALNVIVTGRVQGVGFRPFVYALSKKYELKGTVQNNTEQVNIVLEGEEDNLERMLHELKTFPPKLAAIKTIKIQQIPLRFYKDFSIIPSEITQQRQIFFVTLDAAICKQCLDEMKHRENRRFQYPFINCTQCGPRYTIIKDFPYDRPNTSMAVFPMCLDCQVEYENIQNRRHHAQPICCPKCGPTIRLLNQKCETIAENQQGLFEASKLLKQGNIIAIKGIGGYHLACDAYQRKSVDDVRSRKSRPQRPLAIMVKSLDLIREFCHVSMDEEQLLTSAEMPIVVLQKKQGCILPENIAPGLSTIGVMLPYTPLHHLLFEQHQLECLVMTSANLTNLPIQYKDHHHQNLTQLADYIVTHNREILHPIDDSVVQQSDNNTIFIRKARGFAPEVIKSTWNVSNIIALGGNQKNTIALGKQNDIILSPYIGDLNNEEMVQFFQKQLHQLKVWHGVKEKYIAVDQHPSYTTTLIAKHSNSKVISVHHHHAHHVSCMVDNQLTEPCLGIILDGTGYGEDKHIWGFEFLYGDAQSFERLGHLQYTPLPGGEKAIKEPWRNAVGMLLSLFKEEGKDLASRIFPDKWKEINILEQMIVKKINTTTAGTCGRLFDAVSAILGICTLSTYEGEAASKLADYMIHTPVENTFVTYPFQIRVSEQHVFELDFSAMIQQIVIHKLEQKPLALIIQKFHQTIVSSCVQMVLTIMKQYPHLNRQVVFSGGSFQNMYLVKQLKHHLEKEGVQVYTHHNIPCHDGGLAIGQIVIAARKMAQQI
ncbi:carbamoyltransferase HypF [Lysinibacillus sp. KU-BSD001]|uniref:carbamoyltransferase HypF n=1 Tax=Lysinibacillus sp. KU-BSD001 TaxID=3141328 RepID=UPI0036EECFC6